MISDFYFDTEKLSKISFYLSQTWQIAIHCQNLPCDSSMHYFRDPASVGGQCHHLQGEPGCSVDLDSPFTFRSGRADCVTDSAKPYIATKDEAHPNAMGDGRETVQYFQDEFNLTSQETVALMGAHSFGRFHVQTSLFRQGVNSIQFQQSFQRNFSYVVSWKTQYEVLAKLR